MCFSLSVHGQGLVPALHLSPATMETREPITALVLGSRIGPMLVLAQSCCLHVADPFLDSVEKWLFSISLYEITANVFQTWNHASSSNLLMTICLYTVNIQPITTAFFLLWVSKAVCMRVLNQHPVNYELPNVVPLVANLKLTNILEK